MADIHIRQADTGRVTPDFTDAVLEALRDPGFIDVLRKALHAIEIQAFHAEAKATAEASLKMLEEMGVPPAGEVNAEELRAFVESMRARRTKKG